MAVLTSSAMVRVGGGFQVPDAAKAAYAAADIEIATVARVQTNVRAVIGPYRDRLDGPGWLVRRRSRHAAARDPRTGVHRAGRRASAQPDERSAEPPVPIASDNSLFQRLHAGAVGFPAAGTAPHAIAFFATRM